MDVCSAMREKREMPDGFEKEIYVSQNILRKKYRASTNVISRWKDEAGKVKKEPMMCDYRMGIVCSSSNKSRCGKCGWNPNEEEKIRTILHESGMDAVRKYIAARDRQDAEKNTVS